MGEQLAGHLGAEISNDVGYWFHCDGAAEEPGCNSSCKITGAAPSASSGELGPFNKSGKILFILII